MPGIENCGISLVLVFGINYKTSGGVTSLKSTGSSSNSLNYPDAVGPTHLVLHSEQNKCQDLFVSISIGFIVDGRVSAEAKQTI